jgi:hypothetical protein
MPIRFRCHHCQQLLGIARRKAGTYVRCPTCHRDVLVPLADELGQPPPPAAPAAPAPQPRAAQPAAAPLFERSDFDNLFGNPAPVEPPQAFEPFPPAPAAKPDPALPLFDAEPLGQLSTSQPTPPRPAVTGVMLSPTQATLLTVGAIILLALAFGAGLFVGHYWLG